ETMEKFAGIEDMHRRVFAAMVSELDDSVGRVIQAVDRLGLAEDTLIFFFSDHGGGPAELTSNNHPLRGGKGNFYEGGLRVPFLMRWPGRIPAGQVVDDAIITLDVFPTAMAAAGVRQPAVQQRLDGIDLMAHLRGDAMTLPQRD